jgi:two-component system alkaline phosphatase synthesis response regulator PhoP
MMPEIDGINVCESIRLTNPTIPVMFLSAKSSGNDRVLGLKTGADDYMVKPFNLEELLIRVSKLIQRQQTGSTGSGLKEFHFGGNYINFENFEAIGVNGPFKLTKKETQLLKLLIEHKDEVVSREKILQTVWGYSVFPNTRTIDNFILSFRKYFENPEKSEKYISSMRGVGYKFTLNQEG